VINADSTISAIPKIRAASLGQSPKCSLNCDIEWNIDWGRIFDLKFHDDNMTSFE
jgi:hypothetical protein